MQAFPKLRRLDIAFVVEATECMEDYIRTLARGVRLLDEAAWREGYTLRLGVACFYYHAPAVRPLGKVVDLTTDTWSIADFLERVDAVGECQRAALEEGLSAALSMKWDRCAQKAIVAVCSSPPQGLGSQCPGGLDSIELARRAAESCISLYVAACGAEVGDLRRVAEAAGGGWRKIDDTSELLDYVVDVYEAEKEKAELDQRVLYAVSRLGLLVEQAAEEYGLSVEAVKESLQRLAAKGLLSEEAVQGILSSKKEGREPLALLLLPTGNALEVRGVGEHVFGREDFVQPLSDVSAYLPYLRMISRRKGPRHGHFKIIVREEGNSYSFYVRDDGSSNGTYVRGMDIRGKGDVKLESGDEILLAGVLRLKFIIVSPALGSD